MRKAIQLQVVIMITVSSGMFLKAQAEGSAACARGKASAPIKIEIFNDYQCPACRAFYLQTMRSVFSEYADKGKVCVVYRDFPLQSHPYARQAAAYARASAQLGLRQWNQVADALFESQDEWTDNGQLEAVVAKALGITDMLALRKVLKENSFDEAIDSDINAGLDREVNSTPTFFITSKDGTEKVAAALTYAALQERLDALLGK